jgi:hypothetical protein
VRQLGHVLERLDQLVDAIALRQEHHELVERVAGCGAHGDGLAKLASKQDAGSWRERMEGAGVRKWTRCACGCLRINAGCLAHWLRCVYAGDED